MAAHNHSMNWKKLLLELLVVFLGITAGFILNNWRDGQKNIQLEANYIESFIHNVDSNIVSLNATIQTDTVLLEKLKIKLQVLENSDLHPDSIISFINLILYVSKLDIEASTYEDIKYSGNLNLIHDYNLKEKIVSFYALIEGALYVDGYYNNYFSELILPFVMNNFSLSENKFFTQSPQNQRKMFNLAAGYYSMRLQRTNVLKKVLVEGEKLKAELEMYSRQNYN